MAARTPSHPNRDIRKIEGDLDLLPTSPEHLSKYLFYSTHRTLGRVDTLKVSTRSHRLANAASGWQDSPIQGNLGGFAQQLSYDTVQYSIGRVLFGIEEMTGPEKASVFDKEEG